MTTGCLKALVFFLSTVEVNATLPPSTQAGVIFDDVTSEYWLTDLNSFADMTYTEHIQAIKGLMILGRTGIWHLSREH